MKINLFHKHKLPLNEPIEYIYLALVIFTLVSTALTVYIQNCFDNWQKVVKWINSPIPFSCPKDYSYPNPSKSYYNACLIRFLNLMLMWIMFLTTFFFTVLALIPERKINDLFGVKSNIKNDDERKESDVLTTVLWLVIPIIYTIFTINELGDIPFYCPTNYDYGEPGLRYVCQTRLANLICMWVMFMGILLTGITMIIPKEILIDIFNDDGDEEYQAFNSGGGNRDGYQSVKQNDLNYKQIQIVRQDETDGSSSNGIDGMGRNESEPSKHDKPKGKEETFGFNNDDLQKFIDPDDNDKLKHIV
ncbi:11195_t:CDS:2 [Rhizophagus irregularis]|nr:11195_t:CDS:2 [Rhizophagus irregularis]